jgi:alginate O-acetyltransferase complex protein AlgJ
LDDVDYVTSPGFLDPAVQARRSAASDEWAEPVRPDPRPALLRLKASLEAQGIALIVVPVPVKPTIHPEMLASSYSRPEAAENEPSRPAHGRRHPCC